MQAITKTERRLPRRVFLVERWFHWVERPLARLARQRTMAVVTVLGLALGLRLAVLPVEPIPVPGVHDEFSYLLMGDTFAHGRLTNPTHPMWLHFESMGINQRPTYCSAFYPAQGAFLALGQAVFRHPFWGVWLSTGLMCAAICWALQGWMPRTWAFLGGILAILRFGVLSYWANSYWGGSVAAIGGALALGALPRIKRVQRVRDAIILGLGLAIIANSRPYEGIFYSVPILISLSIFVFGKRAPKQSSTRRIVAPLVAVVGLTLIFMGYYFWRTTGNPFRPPYLVNAAAYMEEPLFMWGKMKAPVEYHNAVMEHFYRTFHVQQALAAQQHPLPTLFIRVFQFWAFFVGPALTVPFLVLVGILPYGVKFSDLGKTRFLLVVISVSFLGLLLPVYNSPHYAAPVTCAMLSVIVQALRRVRIWDLTDTKKGVWVVRAIVAFSIVSFLSTAMKMSSGPSDSRTRQLASRLLANSVLSFDFMPHNTDRAMIIRKLSELPGKYLIVVHYRPDHNPHQEWVYNDAEIDNSKIVWAREIDRPEDQRLIDYFKSRSILLLDADAQPPQLGPYPLPIGQANILASRPVGTVIVSLSSKVNLASDP